MRRIGITATGLSFIAIFLLSCGSPKRNGIYRDLELILSSRIELTDNVIGSDGSDFVNLFADSGLKIVHYINEEDCNECRLKTLHYWRSIMEDADFKDVDFFFVAWSNSAESLAGALHNINFHHTVYADSAGLFLAKNDFFGNRLYNTVLVDGDDKVLLVGDLRNSNRMAEAYRKLIEEKREQ